MSGSPRIPLPTFQMGQATNNIMQNSRYSVEVRKAAVKLLFTLYNEFPLRPEEMSLIDTRIQHLTYADVGWFQLLKEEVHLGAIPRHRFIAGMALLE